MTRCEEFSRGEYAPRLLAYFLFLKSLLHEITEENQLNRSQDSKDKEVENVACFTSPWLLFAISFYPKNFPSFAWKRVKDENYSTTGLQCKVSRIRGIPFFLPGEICVEEKSAFSTTHTFSRSPTSSSMQIGALCVQKETYATLSLHSSFLNLFWMCNDPLKDESIDLFLIFYLYLSI